MGTSGDWSSILDALEASVCSDPTVEFAVAFGSQITGEPNRSSDLDLAVKFTDEQAFERFKADVEATFDERSDTLRRQQRDVIDRIAEDGLRG